MLFRSGFGVRRRGGALQNLAEVRASVANAPASWSAAALRRFRRKRARAQRREGVSPDQLGAKARAGTKTCRRLRRRGADDARPTLRFMESPLDFCAVHWDLEPDCAAKLVWCPAFRRPGPAKAGTPNRRFMESPHASLSCIGTINHCFSSYS